MNFLFTTWIYPLKAPIVLLENPHFVLDNPRSAKEIKQVAALLENNYHQQLSHFFPPTAEEEIISLDWMISEFRKRFKPFEPLIAKILSHHKSKTVFESFARLWLIARYDDEGQSNILQRTSKKMKKAGKVGLVILEDEHPIIRNSTYLRNYLSLLTLLIHTEGDDYIGRPILISSADFPMLGAVFDEHLWQNAFTTFMIASTTAYDKMSTDKLSWTFFPYVNDRLLLVRDSIARSFSEGNGELLMYIGNILRVVQHDARDIRVRFILLISLLELLLTHNPETTRYNVEDSIGRQFRLKTGIMLHLQHHNLNIFAAEQRLKQLYNLRSAIAHGDFKEIDKYKKSLNKKAGAKEYFDQVVVDAYFYLRAVVEQFLKDADFVKFIKKS
jgi:hypothetical protein